ncbi:uncharacterized protein LOC143301022 isoform X2 [Babylonia areolata]|uniref:uncharacterized protein LOC143301022 isoform X2 n=1 Tax=Babylonia areolata TaxID=304850 RepID=UPI003FD372BC
MTAALVTLAKVTGLLLLLVEGKKFAAAENDDSEQCVEGDSDEGADCIFDEDLCEWRSETWKAETTVSSAQFSTDKFHHGVLQSPLICSTESSVHCLSFEYQFVHQYSGGIALTVVLEVKGTGNVSVWQLKSNTGGIYEANAPVQTTADFRILLQVEKPRHLVLDPAAVSSVIVSDITYEKNNCSVMPPAAAVRKSAVNVKPPARITPKAPTTTTSKAPTTSTSRPFIGRPLITVTSLNTKKPSTAAPATRRSRPTRPSVSKRPSPSPSPPSSSAAGSEQSSSMSSKTSDMPVTAASDDSCTGIIIGAVVAVVVIVAVGVFLFVAKRKKMFWFRPKDSSSQPVAMVSLSQRDVVTAPDPASMEGGSANGQSETAGRGNDAPPEGGRHRAAETGRRGTSPTRPAGTGGIQPGPEDGGEYHVVDLVGQRHGPEGARVAGPREGQHVPDDGHYHLPWEDHAPPGAVPAAGSSYLAARGGAEDEYSRLGLAGKKTALAGEKESGGCRLYDHVGGGERDVYSHVQRDREPPVILDQVYSHIH